MVSLSKVTRSSSPVKLASWSGDERLGRAEQSGGDGCEEGLAAVVAEIDLLDGADLVAVPVGHHNRLAAATEGTSPPLPVGLQGPNRTTRSGLCS